MSPTPPLDWNASISIAMIVIRSHRRTSVALTGFALDSLIEIALLLGARRRVAPDGLFCHFSLCERRIDFGTDSEKNLPWRPVNARIPNTLSNISQNPERSERYGAQRDVESTFSQH